LRKGGRDRGIVLPAGNKLQVSFQAKIFHGKRILQQDTVKIVKMKGNSISR
jgi:hypothetical protein